MRASRSAARELRIYHRARLASHRFSWAEHNFSLETPKAILRRWDERAAQAKAVIVRLLGERRAEAFVAIVENLIDDLELSAAAGAIDFDRDEARRDYWEEESRFEAEEEDDELW